MTRFAISFFVLTVAGCGAGGAAGSDGTGGVGFGGAQDIGQFRRILAEGGIPGEATLDANGFFNEHYVEPSPADCGEIICVQGMLSVGSDWVDGSYQAALQISLASPIDPATIERRPLDLVVVVDTSGSMSHGDRIGYVKEGLHLLVDELEEGDRLALVTYDSDVRVLSELDQNLDRNQLHGIVEQIQAGGATNIYDGLQTGFELAAAAFDLDRQTRVIMLSDGQPTAGITDTGTIIGMAEGYISDGVGLTTVGVGLDFNVELMRGLAERGAGNFYFLEDGDAVDEVFTEELDYFVEPLALAVDIQVSGSPTYRLGEVVGTRLWKAEGGSGRVFVPAVFLASRQSQEPDTGRRGGGSALFIRMEPTGEPGDEVGTVRMTYRLPGSDEQREQTIAIANPAAPGEVGAEPYYSEQPMAERFAMYNLYLGLREATRLAAYDYDCAAAVLRRIDDEARRWNAEHADPDIAADRELVGLFLANLMEHGAGDAGDAALCASGAYPDDYHYHCSTGGGSGAAGMAWILLAALVIRCRRRGTIARR